MDTNRSSQGARLDLLRKSLGFSQVDFSAEIGITQGYLSQVILGRRSVSYKILNAITKRFPNSNPEWILTGAGSMLKQDIKITGVEETMPAYNTPVWDIRQLPEMLMALEERQKEFEKRLKDLEKLVAKFKNLVL